MIPARVRMLFHYKIPSDSPFCILSKSPSVSPSICLIDIPNWNDGQQREFYSSGVKCNDAMNATTEQSKSYLR